MQARKDTNRYRRRSKEISKPEKQQLEKQSEDQEALTAIRAVYLPPTVCYHFKPQRVLDKHICGGVMESHDVLSMVSHVNEHMHTEVH